MMGVRVERGDERKGGLQGAFAHNGPALIDVVSNRQELAMPPTIKAQ